MPGPSKTALTWAPRPGGEDLIQILTAACRRPALYFSGPDQRADPVQLDAFLGGYRAAFESLGLADGWTLFARWLGERWPDADLHGGIAEPLLRRARGDVEGAFALLEAQLRACDAQFPREARDRMRAALGGPRRHWSHRAVELTERLLELCAEPERHLARPDATLLSSFGFGYSIAELELGSGPAEWGAFNAWLAWRRDGRTNDSLEGELLKEHPGDHARVIGEVAEYLRRYRRTLARISAQSWSQHGELLLYERGPGSWVGDFRTHVVT